MIVYDPIWKTIKEKKLNQYRLIRYYGISPGVIDRLKKNVPLSTKTIDNLCSILECKIEGIMDYIPDKPIEDENERIRKRIDHRRRNSI